MEIYIQSIIHFIFFIHRIPVHSDGYHWAFPSLFVLFSFSIMCSAGASGYEQSLEIPSSERIPYDLLSKRDPILWHKTILLYEDDLHDFGYIAEECRIVHIFTIDNT